jgi:hypothetical protein
MKCQTGSMSIDDLHLQPSITNTNVASATQIYHLPASQSRNGLQYWHACVLMWCANISIATGMTQRKGSYKNIDGVSKNMTSRPCQRSWRTQEEWGKFQGRGRGVLLLFANWSNSLRPYIPDGDDAATNSGSVRVVRSPSDWGLLQTKHAADTTIYMSVKVTRKWRKLHKE